MRRCAPGRLRSALAFAGVLALASCGPHYAASPTDTTLQVVNRGADDVQIYVLRDGLPIRVGTVLAQSTRQFTLPGAVIGTGDNLRLRAERAITRTATDSQPFFLAAGDSVTWLVEASLGMSTITFD